MTKKTKSTTSKTPKTNDLADKLSKIGSIGKKTDKGNATKSRTTHKPKKNRSGVLLVGGLQDAGRFRFVWLIMALGFSLLLARAFWLQITNADYFIAQGDKLIHSKQTIRTQRGMILDTNGVPLAANAPLTTVIFSPYDYAQAYYNAKKLEKNAKTQKGHENAQARLQAFDLNILAQASGVPREILEQAVQINPSVNVDDAEAILAALPTGTGSKRMVLLNKVAPEEADTVMSLGFAGVFEETFDRRYYLQPEPMAQVLGFMAQSNDDNHPSYSGRAGIEAKYNQLLAGENGQILSLRAVRGSIEQIQELKPMVEGQDVHLTIDARLQYILYKELEVLGRMQSARSSSGVIVDVQTGDVLAMGSWPSFNPNNLAQRTGANERNRPVLDAFEPGSVMKPFTVAAALESGKYSINTLIDTSPGSMRLGGYSIRDGGNYGQVTMGKLIQKSSNVASAKIALSLPANAISDIQTRFGFGQKTALNFPAEVSGLVKAPTEKDITRRATLAYGYGQSVTLAQIAAAYAALGNGGKFNPLRLVKEEPRQEAVQVISKEHADDIVTMMRSVTEKGGTGQAAAIEGYYVAGKTGTSRRANPNGGYYSNQYRNIFAGLAPATNPRFAIAILVEDPQAGKYAGQTVAPVFAKVMYEALRLYNVPHDKP